MYTILVNDDNTLSVTQRTRIMQRSTGFDAIRFLVNPEYKGYSMAECTLTLRYKTPISGELKSERLVLCEELHNGFLQYILPVDTRLTHEAGNIVCNLTFTYADVDTEGKPVIRVRKLNDAKIKSISPKTLAPSIEEYFVSKTIYSYFEMQKNIYKIASLSRNFDCLVLGCTHYVFLKDKICKISKKQAFDGNVGVSKQVQFFCAKNLKVSKTKSSVKFLLSNQQNSIKEIYKKIFNEILAKT